MGNVRIEDVLDALEQSNLVPVAFVARLRIEVTKTPPPHDPKQLIKFLVDKGHITAAQGERLLLAPKSLKPAKPEPAEPYINLDDDLGLAPLEDEPLPKKTAALASAPPPLPPVPTTPRVAAPTPASPAAAAAPVTPVAQPKQVKLEIVEEETLSEDDIIEEKPRALPEEFAAAIPSKKKGKKSVWDSPFLILGGGGLVLLLIAGAAIGWSLFRTTGEEAMALAENDYKNGSYTQAIAKIDQYLEKHPGHAENSRARVMRGLANIRRAAEGGNNNPAALAAAKQELDAIDEEPAFPDARAELAGLLPEIAEGLARQAAEKLDIKMVGQADEALALVNQHVPATMRNTQKLNAITASLDLTRRDVARDGRLRETVAKVNEVAGKLAGAPAADAPAQLALAYDARKQLLKEYPKLATDPALAEAIKKVSASERGAVTVLKDSRAAVTTESPATVRSTLALTSRPKIGAGDAGAAFVAGAPGGVLGISLESGAPLWWRNVGRSSYLPPLPLGGSANGDTLFADTDRRELLRIESVSGKLRWRLPLEEAFRALPTVFGNELLMPTDSGKLLRIDLASGNVIGGWQLPHALEVAPAVDVRRKLVYQLTAHSNLYVLSTDEPVCREVLYLGHDSASILTPPTVVSRYVMVAENTGLKDCVLRVIQTDENGLQLAEAQSEALGGHVDTPPVVDGRNLHVVTDLGGLYAFEIGVPGKAKPLSRLAERAGGLAEPTTHFPIVKDNRLWVAGTEVSRFSVQTAGGKLAPEGIRLEQSIFLQPPFVSGNTVALLRRPPSGLGISALAIDFNGRDNLWETSLAAPLLGGVALGADGQTAVAIDALGNVFRIPPAELGRGGVNVSSVSTPDWPAEVTARDLSAAPARLEGGTLLFSLSGHGGKLLAVPPDAPPRWITLPEYASSAPQAFAGGIAIGGDEGRVFVVDPSQEKNLLEPYQPRVAANDTQKRFGPAVVDQDHLLTADAAGKVTLLAVRNDPKPHLEPEREAMLDEPLGSDPVVLGKVAFAVRPSNSLASIALPSLEFVKSWPLGGKPVWGPRRVGERVLLVNAANELCCWNAAGEEAWRLPLAHGPLAGPPIERGQELILLTRTGFVVRVSNDGAEQAHAETGATFLGAGAIVGQFVIAPGVNGALYLAPIP